MVSRVLYTFFADLSFKIVSKIRKLTVIIGETIQNEKNALYTLFIKNGKDFLMFKNRLKVTQGAK